jgi:hypothetical protein
VWGVRRVRFGWEKFSIVFAPYSIDKGPRPSEGLTQSNLPISLLFFYLSFPLLFQSTMMFFSRLHGVWGCSRWSADPRAIQGASVLTVPPERAFIGLPPDHWQPIWPVTRTGLTSACGEVPQEAPLHACWPLKGINKLATPLGKENLAVMTDLTLATWWRMKNFTQSIAGNSIRRLKTCFYLVFIKLIKASSR